jgi:hypothetical protein
MITAALADDVVRFSTRGEECAVCKQRVEGGANRFSSSRLSAGARGCPLETRKCEENAASIQHAAVEPLS